MEVFRRFLFHYFKTKTYLMGTHWNCLIDAIPMSTHKLSFGLKIIPMSTHKIDFGLKIMEMHYSCHLIWTRVLYMQISWHTENLHDSNAVSKHERSRMYIHIAWPWPLLKVPVTAAADNSFYLFIYLFFICLFFFKENKSLKFLWETKKKKTIEILECRLVQILLGTLRNKSNIVYTDIKHEISGGILLPYMAFLDFLVFWCKGWLYMGKLDSIKYKCLAIIGYTLL